MVRSERAVQELFSTVMSQRCYCRITEAFEPHHTSFHDMLACAVRLAWSTALLRDYSFSSCSSTAVANIAHFLK